MYPLRKAVLAAVLAALVTYGEGKCAACKDDQIGRVAGKWKYPSPRRGGELYTSGNLTVPTPYSWMENLHCPETKAFIAAQNELTNTYFCSGSDRSPLLQKLMWARNFTRYGCPQKVGGKYYYIAYNYLNANTKSLYVKDSRTSQPELLVQGEITSEELMFSPDGAFFVYGIRSTKGKMVKIMATATKTDEPEVLSGVVDESVAWTNDNAGFFYVINASQSRSFGNLVVKYHRLGHPQKTDLVVNGAEMEEGTKSLTVSATESYLILKMVVANDNTVVKFATMPHVYKGENLTFFELLRGPHTFEVVTEHSSHLIVLSNYGNKAVNNREINWLYYVKIAVKQQGAIWSLSAHWNVSINKELELGKIVKAVRAGDNIVALWEHGDQNCWRIYNLDGEVIYKWHTTMFTYCLTGTGKKDMEFSYGQESVINPGRVLIKDMVSTNWSDLIFAESKMKDFNQDDFTFSTGKWDGDDKMDEMLIFHKKGYGTHAMRPTLLLTSERLKTIGLKYDFETIVFINHFCGFVAIAPVIDNSKENTTIESKLNQTEKSLKDFQQAAQFLIKLKYTSNTRLVISGKGEGGVVVAESMNQRPDDYAAGIVQNLKQLKISTLQTIPKLNQWTQYPATLLTTWVDAQSPSSHTLRFAANLQHILGAKKEQTNPLLLRVLRDPDNVFQALERLSFIQKAFRLPWCESTPAQ